MKRQHSVSRRMAGGILTLILAFAILFSPLAGMSAPTEVKAAAKTEYYKIDGKYVGFQKSTGKLTWADDDFTYIPKKVAGKKVKIIGKWAFSGNKKMKTAKIPASVTKIEKGAFYGCKKLKKVVLPKNVKLGDVEAKLTFWESNKLETVVNNPDKNWMQRIQTFEDTLDYLNEQDPQYYVDNVREFKNQWIVDEDGNHVDYTDEAWAVVKAKADELTKGCTTDMQKAKAISKWIVGYLHYDENWMDRFQEWRKTHDEETEVFPLKKVTDAYGLITWKTSEHDGETAMTTCGGYGNLTQALFCAAGIPCVHVHRVQKEGESIDHVFNVAYISGKWRWIDNTYSDETLNYFDCGIAGFAASDHRCDRLNLIYLEDLQKSQENTVSHSKAGDKSGSDSEWISIDGLYWGINRADNAITWFPREWDDTEIPTEIDGMKVTKIGDYACSYHDVRELVIPDGITSIGEGAFQGNHRLSKLTISSDVESLGNYSFQNCDELETVIYEGSKKNIKFGNYVFNGDYLLHPDFSAAYKQGIYLRRDAPRL